MTETATSNAGWPSMPLEIATPRLLLRAFRITDVDDVYSYARDEEWRRFLRVLPDPYTRDDAERFIARQLLLDHRSHPTWAVALDGAVIGDINLRVSAEHRLCEIGYSIARTHWNNGLCTEAAGAVVDAAFETFPELNRVKAMADVRNVASQRVMLKLGMTKEGVLRQNRIERGEPIDEAWHGILRDEWREVRARP
jgi:ribosomal-protein-alanine N-acetyltransferase